MHVNYSIVFIFFSVNGIFHKVGYYEKQKNQFGNFHNFHDQATKLEILRTVLKLLNISILHPSNSPYQF